MRSNEVRHEIGRRLRDERSRLGLTQQGLADAVGASRLSVVHYESGRSAPAAETLVALDGAGVDVRYVLTGVRDTLSGADRERFRLAFSEAQRQAKLKREKLSPDACLDLAWRIYDALGALQPVHRRA